MKKGKQLAKYEKWHGTLRMVRADLVQGAKEPKAKTYLIYVFPKNKPMQTRMLVS